MVIQDAVCAACDDALTVVEPTDTKYGGVHGSIEYTLPPFLTVYNVNPE